MEKARKSIFRLLLVVGIQTILGLILTLGLWILFILSLTVAITLSELLLFLFASIFLLLSIKNIRDMKRLNFYYHHLKEVHQEAYEFFRHQLKLMGHGPYLHSLFPRGMIKRRLYYDVACYLLQETSNNEKRLKRTE